MLLASQPDNPYPSPMPLGLKRYHESKQGHFITFSCYHRQPRLTTAPIRNLFLTSLEQTRVAYEMIVYGYVVMPEHVHLIISEPQRRPLSLAIQALKVSVAKQVSKISGEKSQPFWQVRYYDHNLRTYEKFVEKLRYIHRNPVKRGLVDRPEDWEWSSFRHYATGEASIVEVESQWTAQKRESSTPRTILSPPQQPTLTVPHPRAAFWR